MPKSKQKPVFLLASAGAIALTLGIAAAAFNPLKLFSPSSATPETTSFALEDFQQSQPSQVLPLVQQPVTERAAALQAIAQAAQKSPDQLRARYLLAVDWINQNRGGTALPLLEGLETEYPLLAAPILAKRAQAYAASGQTAAAQQTWQALLQQFPQSPFAAEALFALGQTDRQFWQQAIAQFPAHPRTLEIAQTLLQENPNQPPLLLLLARHGLYLPDIEGVLGRLTTEYADQLTPQDWEDIGFAYWETGKYDSAGKAYAKAASTPINRYRAGRGAHIGDRRGDAIAFYNQTIQTYPDAPETAMALRQMARLARPPQDAIPYLDQLIRRFPNQAAEALRMKAEKLDEASSPEAASQARQTLLGQFGSSDAAAELRWTLAEQRLKAGDLKGAWELARQITEQNPDSKWAAEAGFWIGKWAQQAGQQAEAKKAYEYVLSRHPHSYYAWRSATLLGWDVGDFTTVRQKLPQVAKAPQRSRLPAGSDMLKELYQLGQDRDAWASWQVEFQTFKQPTVPEQFTDGVLRLGVGDRLDGIFMVSSLARRDQPEDQTAHKALKQDPLYWQTLYPFPYLDLITNWSQQRQLNPLLVTALIRQESRFEPKIESVAGAKGLMQVMPDTGDYIAEKINLQEFNLENPEDNIKLGTWYLDYTHRQYDNNSLFAVASYNAGPSAIAGWIERFGFNDPDRFVEQIPYPETKGYVESVFENYWNYLRLYNPQISAQLAQYAPDHVDAK